MNIQGLEQVEVLFGCWLQRNISLVCKKTLPSKGGSLWKGGKETLILKNTSWLWGPWWELKGRLPRWAGSYHKESVELTPLIIVQLKGLKGKLENVRWVLDIIPWQMNRKNKESQSHNGRQRPQDANVIVRALIWKGCHNKVRHTVGYATDIYFLTIL